MPCERIIKTVKGSDFRDCVRLECKEHGLVHAMICSLGFTPNAAILEECRKHWDYHLRQFEPQTIDWIKRAGLKTVCNCQPAAIVEYEGTLCLRCRYHGSVGFYHLGVTDNEPWIAQCLAEAWKEHTEPTATPQSDPWRRQVYLEMLRNGVIPQGPGINWASQAMQPPANVAPIEHDPHTHSMPESPKVVQPLMGKGPPVGVNASNGAIYIETDSSTIYMMVSGLWTKMLETKAAFANQPAPKPATGLPAVVPVKPKHPYSFKRKFV